MHPTIAALRRAHDEIAYRERVRDVELASLSPGDRESEWRAYDEELTTVNLERADELTELLELAGDVLKHAAACMRCGTL